MTIGHDRVNYDLSGHKSFDALEEYINDNTNDMRHIRVKNFWRFIDGVSTGDKVITTHYKKIYIGEVVSDYYFERNDDFTELSSRRKVNWDIIPIIRHDLKEETQKEISKRQTIFEILNHAAQDIENIFSKR